MLGFSSYSNQYSVMISPKIHPNIEPLDRLVDIQTRTPPPPRTSTLAGGGGAMPLTPLVHANHELNHIINHLECYYTSNHQTISPFNSD
jgi:hypothetical protein